jgi:hypothetical protein
MGAYENPKIIVPPDYGEIFRKNFEASKRMVEGSFARAEARREKIRKEEQQIDDRILQFDLTRQEIKAGDLTTSLQNATNFLADDYAENERNRNNISREAYNEKRLSIFRKLNEMKQIGATLTQQSKEYKNFDKSKFQKNGGVADGLFDAYERGEVKFQFVGDDIEMYYKNGEDLIVVDTDNIKEGDFFNINEKFVIEENDKKAFVSGIQLTDSFQTTTTKDGKQITKSIKTYDKDKSELINDIASSSEMNAYFSDIEDAGSIFLDSIAPNNIFKKDNKIQISPSLQSAINIVSKKYGLSEEEAKQFKAKISEESYDEILIGKDKNYRQLVNEVSKLELAKESFEKYAPKEQRGRADAPLKGGGSGSDASQDYVTGINNALNKLEKTDFKNYTKKEDGKDFFSENFLNYIETIPGLSVDRQDFDDGRVLISPTQFAKKLGKEISITPRMTNEEIKRKISIALGVPDNIIEQTNFSKDIENGKLMQGIRDEMARIGMEPIPIVYNGINISQ